MQNHDNPHQVHREDAANIDQLWSAPDKRYSPKVEGAIPRQITNQTRLPGRGACKALMPPMHKDRPRYREEEDQRIVSKLPGDIHDR